MSRTLFCDPYAHQAGGVHAELVPTVKGNTLAVPTFSCGRCHKASQQAGSGWMRHRGVRMHLCSDCKATLQQRAAAPQAGTRDIA